MRSDETVGGNVIPPNCLFRFVCKFSHRTGFSKSADLVVVALVTVERALNVAWDPRSVIPNEVWTAIGRNLEGFIETDLVRTAKPNRTPPGCSRTGGPCYPLPHAVHLRAETRRRRGGDAAETRDRQAIFFVFVCAPTVGRINDTAWERRPL